MKSENELKLESADLDPDFTLTHVPHYARKNWMQIFFVLIGFTFIVTTMATAADLGSGLNMSDLIKVVLIGNIILSTFIGTICWIAAKTGLNTMLLARYALGMFGSKWTSFILGGAQIVWYAFQAAYMGKVFSASLGIEQYFIPITIFWSLLMGSTAIWGTRGIEIVAYVSIIPFLYLVYKIPYESVMMAGGLEEIFLIEPSNPITFNTGVTMIIGTFIAGGLLTPNWARFAKSPKSGFLIAFVAFFIGNVLMAVAGMLGGLVMQDGDMVKILTGLGVLVPAMLILIFNIWTTNNTSAYSFGVAGAEFFNKPNKVPFVIIGLIVSTILAVTGIYEAFISIVEFLGVFIPPLGAIIIADYFFSFKNRLPKMEYVKFRVVRYANLIAYILATVGAYLSSAFAIGIPAINGIVLSFILVYIMNKLFERFNINDHHDIGKDAEYV